MKIYLYLVTLATFIYCQVFGEDCEINTVALGNTWPQGQDGTLKINVPEDTFKWKVEISYDKAPKSISAWQGKKGKCSKRTKTCSFSSQSYNKKQSAGNLLELGYQIGFNEDPVAPKVTSVNFKYCNAKPCPSFKNSAIKEHMVCPGDDVTTTSTPTSGATTKSPTDSPPTEVTTEFPGVGGGNCVQVTHIVDSVWTVGQTGKFIITVPEDVEDWDVQLTFNKPVNGMDAYQGAAEDCNGDICTFINENWNGVQQEGNKLELGYKIGFDTDAYPELTSAEFNGIPFCEGDTSTDNPTTQPTEEPTTNGSTEGTTEVQTTGAPTEPPTDMPTTETPTEGPTDGPTNAPTTEGPTIGPTNGPTTEGPTGTTTQGPVDNGECNTELTNYKEVIGLSLLFYEAQRSGKLPANNRIPYRRDSALTDGNDVGVDLTGGYYDAGDYVKFGFPAAAAMTVLAWGGISYKDGYQAAGEYDNLLDAIKWGTDFFIKCHVSDNEFYGQVGDGDIDHAWWGRPEDMNMERPSMKIDAQNPGSDLAGETAASFASASILFKGKDDAYSAELLDHAKRLFNFADTYRGKYSDSIHDAATFYKSWNGYNDELVWAAAWLYKATGEAAYLDKAKQMYNEFNIAGKTGVFSWDDKNVGIHALMAELTGEQVYKDSLQSFCDNAVSGQTRSPDGMLFYMKWGSLRYASNAAFICLKAADLIDSKTDVYTDLAEGQMNYILGENGQSFVAGYGTNYPKNPHHASSHCPDPPAACGWGEFGNGDENTHILYGALVGGPGAPDDQYNDKRNDYIENEVTLDYNAGFQSVLAGLQMKKCSTTNT